MGTDHPTGILRVLSSRLTGACFGSFLGRPALVLWAGREASLCSGFSWALWGSTQERAPALCLDRKLLI